MSGSAPRRRRRRTTSSGSMTSTGTTFWLLVRSGAARRSASTIWRRRSPASGNCRRTTNGSKSRCSVSRTSWTNSVRTEHAQAVTVGVGGGEGETEIHLHRFLQDAEAELDPGVAGGADGRVVGDREADLAAAGEGGARLDLVARPQAQ